MKAGTEFKKTCAFQCRDYPKIFKIVCGLSHVECEPEICPLYKILCDAEERNGE